MQGRRKSWPMRIIRWIIPFLLMMICLCFRFLHLRWQLVSCAVCGILAFFFFRPKRGLVRRDAAAVVVFLLALLFLVIYLVTGYGMTRTQYAIHDLDRNMYREKKILVMVPHQDDEINLFGGLFETFEEGSEVYVMYYTNGDRGVVAETRIQEAVNALDQLGVDREHIILLGYGDGMSNAAGTHVYNSQGDEIALSSWQNTETYAVYGFQPYRHSLYTHRNITEDIKTLLMELRPDVIFCIDYDSHRDHRALSLFFEESMGEILRQENYDYFPVIFKGFGYSTAYLGEPDFYAENIRSSMPWSSQYPYPGNAYEDDQGVWHIYKGENNIYLWEKRIRFPVAEETISRTLRSSALYGPMLAHESQDAFYSALSSLSGIINGDKVFWLRRDTSLLYHAAVSVSSGDGSALTDFKLADSIDVNDIEHKPFDHLWIPEENDDQRMATFVLDEETAIDTIFLYDNPSLADNILRASISFSDGSSMECGPLVINGSATEIRFTEKRVTSFSVQILEREGERPGLTEVEAYDRDDVTDVIPEIIKLQDEDENFVYDYWLSDQPAVFSVYNSRASFTDDVPLNYMLKVLRGDCEIISNEDHTFTVSCKKGKSAELGLYVDGGTQPLDLVTVRNPYFFERWWNALLGMVERIPGYHTPEEQYAYFRQIITDFVGERADAGRNTGQ